MTNTRCHTCPKRLTSRNATLDTSTINRLCNDCYDYAGWENSHNDDDHTPDDADPGCPVCIKEFNMGDVIVHILHTSEDTGRKNRSHTACDHERTPAGRAACRKANKK